MALPQGNATKRCRWNGKLCRPWSDCTTLCPDHSVRKLRIIMVISFDKETLWKQGNHTRYEPPHDKTNKMVCAPREDSYQPGHLPSLIRVLAVCMKKPWVLSYPLSAQRRLIILGRCPGWSESSLGAQIILLVLSWDGSVMLYQTQFYWVSS